MKRGSTLFLKAAVILIGAPILAACIFLLSTLIAKPVNPEFAHILYPLSIGMLVTAIPFFFALYQAFSLITYIDKKEAFSQLSVKALEKIKYCAFIISTVYVLISPFIYLLAQIEDAPGVIVIGMIIIFASLVISVFAAVLQRLLQEVIHIKSENDLTI